MECVYNGKRFLRLQWSGDGFHSQCILAIFIRWSVVGFCLCSYHDMICFNVAAVMNPEFLSALRRKLRSPQPRGNFLVCSDTFPEQSLLTRRVWMGPFCSDCNCNCGVSAGFWRLGRSGISSRWDSFHGVRCEEEALAEFLSDHPLSFLSAALRPTPHTAKKTLLLLIKKRILKYLLNSWPSEFPPPMSLWSELSRASTVRVKIGRV